MEGIDTRLMGDTDLVVTCTGNTNVCDAAMLQTLKPGAVVSNIGHFDNEIDTRYMRDNWRWEKVKDQVHQVFRSDAPGDYLILLSRGAAREPGQRDGTSFPGHGRILRQPGVGPDAPVPRELGQPAGESRAPLTIEVLPKKLDEEVAELMVAGFGGTLTKLTNTQADYIGVDTAGPFKPESYKY